MPESPRYMVDKRLDKWLEQQQSEHPDALPNSPGVSHAKRYEGLASYLAKNVHTTVEIRALLQQIREGDVTYDQAAYLTHHGPGHVDLVTDRATSLLRETGVELSPYEGFLLLAAIQVHDVGNAFGREAHNLKCTEVMTHDDVRPLLGDTVEFKVIQSIAAAHGGLTPAGSPDTISAVNGVDDLFGHQVRLRFLCAVLRFADELADDRSRADRFGLRGAGIPEESLLFHEYSYALHSVIVDGADIRLKFDLETGKAMRQFAKGAGKVWLLDEIYGRTRKMHRERIYCMRFWPEEHRTAKRVSMEIEVNDEPQRGRVSVTRRRITDSLEESGYPGVGTDCPLCVASWPERPTGEILAAELAAAPDGSGGPDSA